MGGFAWVTLATNDSYSLGALVLAHSLKQAGTQQQLAVLVTPGVTGAMREKLLQVFNIVQEVNILDSKDEANLRLLKRPELGITFTKLHCWRLTQFDKCVFLDADTLVLENCDELFEREELSAAPDVGWPDCFNSGVFVYRPSNETYEKLIQFALEKGSFDGGDQGLLNLYFSDWAHKDISKHLPFIYNMCSTACYSYLPAFKQFGGNAKIIHFIGATKPWLQYFDTETKQVHPSGEAQHIRQVLQHWWNIFCSLIHPNLTSEMSHTVHGSPSNYPETIPHTSHYEHHVPTPHIPNPADDYQNMWDPWEEYDLRQSQNQSNNPSSEFSQVAQPQEQSFQGHGHSNDNHGHSFENQSHSFENQGHSFENQGHSFENQGHSFENQGHSFQNEGHYSESHNQSYEDRGQCHEWPAPSVAYNQSFNIFDNHRHSYSAPETHHHIEEHDYSSNMPQHHGHETQIIESSQQNQLVESHNTNAHSDAGNHGGYVHQHDAVVIGGHNFQPPTPIYQHHPPSQPTPPIVQHYHPPPQKPVTTEPPPHQQSLPKLPDECVTTTTVSNEIELHTSTCEGHNDNDSGLAGAFAQLTLGTPRTPEQAALDDHLRRQGWEVGNIDYLGRDSFENIWSKICETLAEAPAAKPKAPSPPTTSEAVAPEEPSLEAISKTEPPPEPAQQIQQEAKPVEAQAVPEVATSQTTEFPPEVSTLPQEPIPEPVAPPPAPETLTGEPPITPQPAESKPIEKSEITASSIEPVTESTPAAIPLPESPKPSPETPTEVPIPLPESPKPVPDTPEVLKEAAEVLSETPKAAPEVVPETPPSPVPESPKPTPDLVPVTLQDTPIPLPESPKPTPEAPTSPLPAVPSETPKLLPEAATESPQPAAIPLPESPKPVEDVPEGPKLVQEQAPESPKPIAENAPESPKAAAPESPKPAPPESPKAAEPVAPESPKVVTPVAAESPKPTTPESPKPTAPESPKPVIENVKAASESPSVAKVASESAVPTESLKPEPVVECKKPASKPEKKSAETPPESPKPDSAPQTCPVAPKSSSEKKTSKKLKEVAPAPKAEVTEATPPTTPASPQPKQAKQALVVDTSTPDTPPPASSEASGATPTPPPRKSSGAPKKTTTKTKK